MKRSISFRESMEHPVSSSHPNMLRSTSPIAQTDVTNFFQCLRFDPKVVASDHKSIRQVAFKRQVNIALRIQEDEPPSTTLKGELTPSPIPEEIKRLKAGLRENNVKARERVKIFNEASSVFHKFFPRVPTKKRSRPEGYSTDSSGDRLALGPGVGIQGQTLPGYFELDQQKLDDRPKRGALNKRRRTSMMDVQSNAIVRQSAAVDRDKDTMRLANYNAVHDEDRSSIGLDGWEKSKKKRKRSGIKTDRTSSLASNTAVDGYRDLKQRIPKSVGDSRSRLNGDSNVIRHGAVNGAVPYGRSDNLSQQTGLAGRSLLSKDPGHNSMYNEKREQAICSDKEGVNLRAVNKSNNHDESNSLSPTSNPKINASVRGPRLGSGLPKLSPHPPSDWDISGCTNKPPLLSGVPNRKFMTSNRSSSPPVMECTKKRSRVRRRANLVPVVSRNDDFPSSDIADVGGSETGFGFHRHSPAASPQMKLKGENNLSTTALSGSEEFSPLEIKSKDKGKQSDEVDGETSQNVPNVCIPGLQSRRNKLVCGEELGDGVRRRKRRGRGFASTMSVNPMAVTKHGTAKQLRSARNSSDKSESRAGHPPTRKLPDRKACKRQRSTATNATTLDFPVGSDDGHEELLPAANSAIHFAQNFPSSFWKQMERYFCFLSDAHINILKQQVELSSVGTTPVGTSSELDSRDIFPEELATSRVDTKAAPLYQKLLSAIISEDSTSVDDDLQCHGFGDDAESETSVLNHMVEFNGYRSERLDSDELEDDVCVIPFKGIKNLAHHVNGRFSDPLSINFSDIQYETLGIDEKIYIEAQSLGICIEPMPSISNVEDEEIVDKIKTLEKDICDVGSKKKEMLNRLLTSALEMRQLQEKELDRLGGEPLSSSTKGKTSERDKDGKGQAPSSNKIGRPKRKSKTKPRKKTAPTFSSSVNILEPTRTSLSKPTSSNNLETLDESEPLDFSQLQIPDGLGGPDDFDTQAGDLSSWLNMVDDALPDTDDHLGLQIPMDDLSDLNMMI